MAPLAGDRLRGGAPRAGRAPARGRSSGRVPADARGDAADAQPARWKDEIILYSIERGCGLRRDSFHPALHDLGPRAVSELRRPGTPFVYESGLHPDQVSADRDDGTRLDYAQIYQPLLDIGASYVGLGFNPWHALHTHAERPDLLGRITSRIGYRIRPAIVWLKRTSTIEPKWLTVGLINDGVAPPSGTLTLTAAFDWGPTVSVVLPPGRPDPGPMGLTEIPLPPDFTAYGNGNALTLSLSLRLGGKDRSVRWAVPPTPRRRTVIICASPYRAPSPEGRPVAPGAARRPGDRATAAPQRPDVNVIPAAQALDPGLPATDPVTTTSRGYLSIASGPKQPERGAKHAALRLPGS
jgi:hypothetical protein